MRRAFRRACGVAFRTNGSASLLFGFGEGDPLVGSRRLRVVVPVTQRAHTRRALEALQRELGMAHVEQRRAQVAVPRGVRRVELAHGDDGERDGAQVAPARAFRFAQALVQQPEIVQDARGGVQEPRGAQHTLRVVHAGCGSRVPRSGSRGVTRVAVERIRLAFERLALLGSHHALHLVERGHRLAQVIQRAAVRVVRAVHVAFRAEHASKVAQVRRERGPAAGALAGLLNPRSLGEVLQRGVVIPVRAVQRAYAAVSHGDVRVAGVRAVKRLVRAQGRVVLIKGLLQQTLGGQRVALRGERLPIRASAP